MWYRGTVPGSARGGVPARQSGTAAFRSWLRSRVHTFICHDLSHASCETSPCLRRWKQVRHVRLHVPLPRRLHVGVPGPPGEQVIRHPVVGRVREARRPSVVQTDPAKAVCVHCLAGPRSELPTVQRPRGRPRAHTRRLRTPRPPPGVDNRLHPDAVPARHPLDDVRVPPRPAPGTAVPADAAAVREAVAGVLPLRPRPGAVSLTRGSTSGWPGRCTSTAPAGSRWRCRPRWRRGTVRSGRCGSSRRSRRSTSGCSGRCRAR